MASTAGFGPANTGSNPVGANFGSTLVMTDSRGVKRARFISIMGLVGGLYDKDEY